jgi:ketosteroid isomerase-like protein
VALSGELALVGAVGANNQGSSSGAAYVFEKQGDGTWMQVAKLSATDSDLNDTFGFSVDLLGGRALIGALFDDEMGNNSGAAYIFEQQVGGLWLQTAKLTASEAAGDDRLGYSVALAEDLALVGALGDDDNGADAGAVYVFEQQPDDSWMETHKITASAGGAGDDFGFSAAVDGTRALIGAKSDDDQGSDGGAAYIFEQQGDGSWMEMAKLTASDGATMDAFGQSVSLSGDRALIGSVFSDEGDNSGAAYIFERQGDGSWMETAKLNGGGDAHEFGGSVALAGDLALVGAVGADDLGQTSGTAFVFEHQDDGSWMIVAEVNATDINAGNYFGWSVALSGERGLFGSPSDTGQGSGIGAAYVLEGLSSFPTAVEEDTDLPTSYELSQVYPNPFNPQARVSLSVGQTQQVRVEVYDALGHRVGTLHEGMLAGQTTHEFTFQAGSLPSGMYLIRVQGETFTDTRMMTLLK